MQPRTKNGQADSWIHPVRMALTVYGLLAGTNLDTSGDNNGALIQPQFPNGNRYLHFILRYFMPDDYICPRIGVHDGDHVFTTFGIWRIVPTLSIQPFRGMPRATRRFA